MLILKLAQGALIALFVAWAVIGSWQSSQESASQNRTQEPSEATSNQDKKPKTFGESMDAVAVFTLCLVLVGVIQLRFFYVQLRLIRYSLDDAKIAAEAAKEAADTAKSEAEVAQATLKTMQDTAERQLRAYVMIHTAYIQNLGVGHRPKAKLVIRNTGQTPAHHVTHWCSMGIAPYEIPAGLIDALKQGEIEMPSKPLPPTGETELWADDAPLTQQAFDAMKNGTHAMYVIGEIRYRDVFSNEMRETDFLLFAGGSIGVSGELAGYKTGNRAT